MSHVAGAGGAAAAHQAMIANAIKASGAIVRVEPQDFMTLLDLAEDPLVVYAKGGFFSTTHQYLVSVRGLAFVTKSPELLQLPGHALLIESKQIWIPG